MSLTETEPAAPSTTASPRKSYLLFLGLTPDALTRIVDCVKPERYDERTEPDRFSLREAIAHLADFEKTVLDRMGSAVESPGTLVDNFDEEARCREKAYATRDVHHELEVFGNRRRETVMFLENLNSSEMRKTFVHPQRGEMSIREFAGLILGHDVYHIEHATQYLR